MPSATSLDDLSDSEFNGKVVLITGATSGIGEAAALEFGRRQAKVIMLVRSLELGKKAIEHIQRQHPAADLHLMEADLSLTQSVVNCIQKLTTSRIDILVNNAGVYGSPFKQTKEGVEITLATNHLGHFLLTCLLLSRNMINSNARVIMLTCSAYKDGNLEVNKWNSWTRDTYDKKQAYKNSKLGVCLFGLWLRSALHRLAGPTAMVYIVHPGAFHTDCSRHLVHSCVRPCQTCLKGCMIGLLQSPKDGCKSIVLRAADLERDSSKTGTYFNKGCPEAWHKPVLNADLVMRCWDFSFETVREALAGEAEDELKKLKTLRSLTLDTLDDLKAC